MIILATSVHDPHAGLQWIWDLHLTQLQSFFDGIVLISSPFTNDDFLKKIKEAGVFVTKRKDNKVGKTYFESVKQGSAFHPDYLFYCDFDRILHWIHTAPEELKSLLKFLEHELKKKHPMDYIICERTSEGYLQHHDALYETEQLPNKIISHAMGEKKFHDFLSGAFIFSHKAFHIIQKQGGSDGYQFWGDWPLFLKKKKMNILYKQFHGLNWETPNQNREAVKLAGGVKKWREQLSTPAEWKRRTAMAREFVENII